MIYLVIFLIVAVHALIIIEFMKLWRENKKILNRKIVYKAAAQTYQEKYEEVCREMRKK